MGKRPLEWTGCLAIAGGLFLPWSVFAGASAQMATLAFGLLMLMVAAIVRDRDDSSLPVPGREGAALFFFAWAAVTLSVLQFAFTDAPFGAQNYLAALIVGVAVALFGVASIMRRLLLVALCVSLAIMAWEHLSGSYLFAVTVDGQTFGESWFAGAQDIMRAKGLFTGPITAAMFGVVVAAAYRGHWQVWALAAAHAGLAQGRLALLLLVIGALVFGLSRAGRTAGGGRRGRAAALALVGSIVAVVLVASPGVRDNYLSTFDFGADRNQGRVYYWERGLQFISDGDFAAFWIGDPRGTYEAFGNSGESDYIQAFADTGLLGWLLLMIAAVWAAYRVRPRNPWLLLLAAGAAPAATFAALPLGAALWIAVFGQLADRSEPAEPAPDQRTATTENSL